MTGNRGKGLVLQERDRHLFRELTVMRVIDCEQAKMVAGFGSTSRANSRLLMLTRSGLLRRFFVGTRAGGKKALYTLTARASQIIGVPHRDLRRRSDEILVADFFINHQLSLNAIYCALKYRPIPIPETKFLRWLTFNEPLESGTPLIPDAYAEVSSPGRMLSAFLEVDLGHEGRNVWKGKVQRYLAYAISGNFEKQFRQPQFRVLVVTNSERRLQWVSGLTAKQTEKLFWFSTFDSIHRDGFWSPIWLRPNGDQMQSLL